MFQYPGLISTIRSISFIFDYIWLIKKALLCYLLNIFYDFGIQHVEFLKLYACDFQLQESKLD